MAADSETTSSDLKELLRALRTRVPVDAAELLAQESPETIAAALDALPPALAAKIAHELPESLRPVEDKENESLPEHIGEILEAARGVLPSGTTVAQAVEWLRSAESVGEITYLYVVDGHQKLMGLVVMRDLLLAQPGQALDEIMLRRPFSFQPGTKITEAIKLAVKRHYPVYPVVDGEGKLVGVLRGWRLAERQAIEISAQVGQLVGVDKEEKLSTPISSAFKMRHPWLQVNLLTAFIDVLVVGSFSDTIEKIVALAAFLPVLAGQAGNTGCQALAITLRGITLGELQTFSIKSLFTKELMLGMLNGIGTGIIAAGAMYWYASPSPDAFRLAMTIGIAMVGGCAVAGFAGITIPLLLRRFGADPVTASAIFLTTCTDIAGMGLMLILATAIVL